MRILDVFVVAAMPIAEIRVALPLALYYGFDPIVAYAVALTGNLLPVPILLILLEQLIRVATRFGMLDRIYRWTVARVERRKAIVEKYGYVGLALFVAVPLPVTGAWTGSLLAFLLRLNKTKSFVAIAAGVSVAGLIVLAASLGVIKLVFITGNY